MDSIPIIVREKKKFFLPAVCAAIYLLAAFFFEPVYGWPLACLALVGVAPFLGKEWPAPRACDGAVLALWLVFCLSFVFSKDYLFSAKYFLLFLFPVPILYFSGRNLQRHTPAGVLMSWIVYAAVITVAIGLIEMVTLANPLMTFTGNDLFSTVFKGRRMMATQQHPAALGTLLAAAFPCSFSLLMLEKKPRARMARAIPCALIGLGLVLTFSRGALAGFLCSLIVLALLLSKRKKAAIGLLVAGTVLFFGVMAVSRDSEGPAVGRFNPSALLQRHEYGIKTARFAMAMDMAREYPIVGVGPGNFRIFFDRYNRFSRRDTPGYYEKVPDCVFAAFLAECGWAGVGVFLAFLALVMAAALRAIRARSGEGKIMSAGLLCGLIGMLGTFFTYDALYWTAPAWLFWVLAGFIVSDSRVTERGHG